MQRQDLSKHAKYTTQNPISKFLVTNFYADLVGLYEQLPQAERFIEVGCGEGFITNLLTGVKKPKKAYAIDLDSVEVADAKANNPDCEVLEASIYDIPFESGYFDTVVCCEVLEHLEDPEKAIAELHRVADRHVLLSVPHEPLWRAMNMARLKYWGQLGNTPDHRNHWSIRGFRKFVGPYFNIVGQKTPIPWTMLLCEKKS